uniref:Cytochrome c-552/4 domain-containing protein n=1 Tax=Schlesneria paludicola TaxID=360056 RepID=A0A7C4LMD6_9PLAN
MLARARTLRSATVMFGLLLGLVGCGGWTGESSPPSTGRGDLQAPPPEPLLQGWERPAAALMLSAEQFGYLEPCGCSLLQSGGLARRASLEAQLRDKGWPLAGLDAGGIVKRSRTQDQLKFEAILAGLKQLNYAAVAAGTAELRLQPDYLIGQFTEGDGIPLGGLLVSANVVFFDQPALGVPKPWKVLTVGEVKIGVTAVLGEKAAAEVAPAGVQTNITITPAADALREVLPQLQAEQPDWMVLLAHGSPEEARTLAEQFPEFSVILTTGGAEEPPLHPTLVGTTWLLEVGHKGKHVGILGYYPQAAPKFRWEVVNLDNQRFPNDPRMEQVMREYQQLLRERQLAESDELLTRHPSGRTFVGAARCGECHKNAFKKWSGTKHAQAFESLKRGRKGQEQGWINRIYDPECLSCHVTGWNPQDVLRYDSGFLNEQATPHLRGQQCENCHGPGSHHAELEWRLKETKSAPDEAVIAARKEVKLNSATAEKDVCIKCHDGDNSPTFQFKKYWEEVRHPWKD